MIVKKIAEEMSLSENQVSVTLNLLEEGNTVPFIARYRKESTHGLDEEQIRQISEKVEYQKNLEKRKEDVARLIDVQGKLTEEIKRQLDACTRLSQVEDIYRPYQQKKKTRAGIAKQKGLLPFCEWILAHQNMDMDQEAKKYLSDDVKTIEEAKQGAKDILAESISDDLNVRKKVYQIMQDGKIITKIKKNASDENKIYRMYYDFSSFIHRVANHQILAINRGEKEKVITVNFDFRKEDCLQYALKRLYHQPNENTRKFIEEAVKDGLERLAFPSIENQIRSELTEKAEKASMEVFSMNLEKLLLQPPLKDRVILGFDPAYRTGCKLAVIDATGKMQEVSVIYPHVPVKNVTQSEKELKRLIDTYHVNVIAIGNGTASRESERFVSEFIAKNHLNVFYTMVSEAGASVYSASELARKEYPDLTVEKRSAISIARRLMDPLVELIKIDPEAIGVGQYQHDMPQKELKQRLNFVVEKAVNRVGVNVNTASVELLKHVSGLTSAMAESIVKVRDEKGKITNRKELHSIPKIGAKSFEQAAGFLRILDSSEPLDATSIHPESYALAYRILDLLKMNASDIGTDAMKKCFENCDSEKIMKEADCDAYTFEDIKQSFLMPLRDYRENFDQVLLRQDILEMEDLKIHDKLQGTVRNVVDFGAFVDIGLHDDGLIHISKMSKQRISHPSERVSVGDIVDVWVDKIDEEKKKVQLTMIEPI